MILSTSASAKNRAKFRAILDVEQVPQRSLLSRLKVLKLAISLLVSLSLWFPVVGWDSTAKLAAAPIDGAARFQSASPLNLISSPQVTAAAVFSPFLTLIPDQNGATVFISAGGVNQLGGTVFANLEIGPAHKKGGYAMTYSDTLGIYLTEAAGFTPGLDEGGTLSLTTTTGLNSETIEFQRAFVQTTQPEQVLVDNGNFSLDLPNMGSVPYDGYVAVMATQALPGPLPPGYNLASRVYDIRPSGSLTQSEKFMTLELAYSQPLPLPALSPPFQLPRQRAPRAGAPSTPASQSL